MPTDNHTPLQNHEEYFWERVNKNGPIPEHRPELGPCWIWTGNVNEKGYGRYYYREIHLQAHVFSYKLHYGGSMERQTNEDLAENQRDHLCRVRKCVNPTHLEHVTRKENILRGEGLPAQNARKTECKHGHDPSRMATLGSGGRYCRECNRLRAVDNWKELQAKGKPFQWAGDVITPGNESPTKINASKRFKENGGTERKTYCKNGHALEGKNYCVECNKQHVHDRYHPPSS